MHICEDQFIAEIIDPNTGEVLPDGEKGELVFTSLNKQAFPMVRYRTRDICVLSHEKCSCGRTHVRMSKPMGRSDDMLIIKGVNVFPSQVETVLIEHGYSPNYQLVVDRVNNSDTLDINVEMNPDMFSDNLGEITATRKELVNALKASSAYTRESTSSRRRASRAAKARPSASSTSAKYNRRDTTGTFLNIIKEEQNHEGGKRDDNQTDFRLS